MPSIEEEEKVDDLESDPLVLSDNCVHKPKEHRYKHRHLISWLLLLELANLVVFIGGPHIMSQATRWKSGVTGQKDSLDRLNEIAQFNRTWVYDTAQTNDIRTNFYGQGWEDIRLEHGYVTIEEQVINQHGIPHSKPTPDRPGEQVYQVSLFHSLHCLSMVRMKFIENEVDVEDLHIQHCFNYLRQHLMCNADLGLHVLKNYKDIDPTQPNTCRDYKALSQWVDANRWLEFWEFQFTHNETFELPEPSRG